jgi:hypothetical protein
MQFLATASKEKPPFHLPGCSNRFLILGEGRNPFPASAERVHWVLQTVTLSCDNYIYWKNAPSNSNFSFLTNLITLVRLIFRILCIMPRRSSKYFCLLLRTKGNNVNSVFIWGLGRACFKPSRIFIYTYQNDLQTLWVQKILVAFARRKRTCYQILIIFKRLPSLSRLRQSELFRVQGLSGAA